MGGSWSVSILQLNYYFQQLFMKMDRLLIFSDASWTTLDLRLFIKRELQQQLQRYQHLPYVVAFHLGLEGAESGFI